MRQVLTYNATAKAASKRTIDGEDYMVVPVVALKEGILNGVFYSASEIQKFAEAWNGVPVPVGHPAINGVNVSANTPEFEGKQNIGKFYNAKCKGGKLKGEIWINIEKAKRLGFASVITHFEQGKLMEVSTGLFGDRQKQSSVYNNQAYAEVMTEIRPDHLALLPGEIGACSIEDGCGAMRTNGQCDCEKCNPGQDEVKGFVERFLTTLTNALTGNAQKEGKMEAKTKKIDALIANKDSRWTEDDRETLAAMDEAVLDKIAPAVAANAENGEGDGDENANGDPAEVNANTSALALNADERIRFERMMQRENAEIETLRKVVKDGFTTLTEEQVKALDIGTLETLARSIKPHVNFAARAGAGTPTENNQTQAASPFLLRPVETNDNAQNRETA